MIENKNTVIKIKNKQKIFLNYWVWNIRNNLNFQNFKGCFHLLCKKIILLAKTYNYILIIYQNKWKKISLKIIAIEFKNIICKDQAEII